jgi:hypothetical protein
MVKKIFGCGLLLAGLLVWPWLAGCAGPSDVMSVNLNEPFSLAPGQSASVSGEGLTVRFVSVIGDSRCPEGATCIWAGEVSCQMEITYENDVVTKVLIQPGHSQPEPAVFADYAIDFDVQPYPQVDNQINEDDYRLQLTIMKATGI